MQTPKPIPSEPFPLLVEDTTLAPRVKPGQTVLVGAPGVTPMAGEDVLVIPPSGEPRLRHLLDFSTKEVALGDGFGNLLEVIPQGVCQVRSLAAVIYRYEWPDLPTLAKAERLRCEYLASLDIYPEPVEALLELDPLPTPVRSKVDGMRQSLRLH